MYLITHPRRMFRVGDKVLHVGQGNTYRGKVGRVVKVEGSKVTGNVTVKWADNVALGPQRYSAAWSRENLLVHMCDLSTDYHDFGGRKYVTKYARFVIAPSQASILFGRILSHAAMKAKVDSEGAANHSIPAHHLSALLGIPVRIDSGAPIGEPGVYTVKLNVAEPEPKPAKVWDFPVLVRRVGTDRISTVANAGEWELLQDGEYEIFSKVSSVTVKPVSKKEIVFS